MQTKRGAKPPEPTLEEIRTKYEIVEVVAFVDTVRLFVARRDQLFETALEKRYGNNNYPFIPVERKRMTWNRSFVGWTASLHQPTREDLEFFALWQGRLRHQDERFRLIVSRVDVAVDFVTESASAASYLKAFATENWRVIRGREGDMRHVEQTTYGNRAGAPRNLTRYCDRSSKLRPGRPCCHVELRLTRPAIAGRPLADLGALLTLNPHQLFRQHVRTGRTTEELRKIRRSIKLWLRDEAARLRRLELAGRLTTFHVQYAANMPRRAWYVAMRGRDDLLTLAPDRLEFPMIAGGWRRPQAPLRPMINPCSRPNRS